MKISLMHQHPEGDNWLEVVSVASPEQALEACRTAIADCLENEEVIDRKAHYVEALTVDCEDPFNDDIRIAWADFGGEGEIEVPA